MKVLIFDFFELTTHSRLSTQLSPIINSASTPGCDFFSHPLQKPFDYKRKENTSSSYYELVWLNQGKEKAEPKANTNNPRHRSARPVYPMRRTGQPKPGLLSFSQLPSFIETLRNPMQGQELCCQPHLGAEVVHALTEASVLFGGHLRHERLRES